MNKNYIYSVLILGVFGTISIVYMKLHNNIDVAAHEVPTIEGNSSNQKTNSQSQNPEAKQKRNVANSQVSYTRLDAGDYNPCSQYIESDDEEENDIVAYNNCIVNGQRFEISTEGVKFPYLEELSEMFTPEIEAKFDVFLVVNTEDATPNIPANTGRIGVPRQHVRVLVKKHLGTNNVADNIFRRNGNGDIVGVDNSKLNENIPALAGLNQVPGSIQNRYERPGFSYLVPSTTGSASYKKTSNGVYLVNEVRSDSHQNRGPEAPMSFQTYIDTRYASGQESGIAIHGTPSGNHRLLGVQRGSHGCARVHPTHARIIRDYLETLQARQVPKLNWQEWKSFELQPSPLATQMVSRIPVLFVIFNGYRPSNEHFAIEKAFEFDIWNTVASN